jgi:2-oxoisovalerate dehydrogenase E1 component
MESIFFPQKEWIIDAIHERLYPLPGHQVTTNQKISELIKRNQLGL